MLKKIASFLLLFSFTSCNVLVVQHQSRHTTKNNIVLGSLGRLSGIFLSQDFQTEVIPKYDKQIKVDVQFLPFTKMTYNAYKKAAKQKNKQADFSYNKDEKQQKVFVRIQILDKELIVEQLYHKQNSSVIAWIKQNPKTKAITSISTYLSDEYINEFKKADAIFLRNGSYKNYTLVLYKNNKKFKSISFADMIPFSYKLSGFCWSEAHWGTYKISGLRNENSGCGQEQYKSYYKAQQSNTNKIKY